MKINFIYRPDRGEYTTYINESYHGMLNPHELLKLINITEYSCIKTKASNNINLK